jgi:hypothetical protein
MYLEYIEYWIMFFKNINTPAYPGILFLNIKKWHVESITRLFLCSLWINKNKLKFIIFSEAILTVLI